MPPAYVKAYLRRQKNDAADAEAICEAVRRPTMRFVPVKVAQRQAVLVLHRSRELLVRQRIMLINAIRGHCAEFGLISAQGVSGTRDLIERAREADSAVLPDMAKAAMMLLIEQLHALVRQIAALNQHLLAWHRQDQASQRLATIPGVGIISATALAASVTDPAAFRSGREFSASLGLVPRQNSSGWGGSRRWEIATSESCSWSARHRWCGGPGLPILPPPLGFAACSSASRPGSLPSPWPTRPPGSCWRCWRAVKPIARRLRHENNRGAHARPRRIVRVPVEMMMTI